MDVQEGNLRRWDLKALLGVVLIMGALVIILVLRHEVGKLYPLGFLICAMLGFISMMAGSYLLITHASILRLELRIQIMEGPQICLKCGFGN
ncbi:MAG: hypothetical protein ACFFFG_17740 [Candidatus Thorarchaeota archaeon]